MRVERTSYSICICICLYMICCKSLFPIICGIYDLSGTFLIQHHIYICILYIRCDIKIIVSIDYGWESCHVMQFQIDCHGSEGLWLEIYHKYISNSRPDKRNIICEAREFLYITIMVISRPKQANDLYNAL